MTIERFQSIVLRLANQTMVRYYLHLNHPNVRQKAGIDLENKIAVGRLHDEMISLGFEYDSVRGMYTIWIDK